MPGCGCAAPPPSIPPTSARPQSRGYLPSGTSSYGGGGGGGGISFSNQTNSSFSSADAPAAADANESNVPAFNAPPAMSQQQSMSRSSQRFAAGYKSPLKAFDTFATKILKQKEDAEEDFPKLTMPSFRGLHKCKVSSLNYHQVDLSVELDQELRNIGIQGTIMMENLERLLKAEAACQFQGAVRAAELAAMAAPNGLAEEAAVAASRGYSVDAQQFSRTASGDNPIEIVGYIGCTRPDNF